MKEHFAWLGLKVRDVVTGFSGVVTSISFDLYGCIQAVVHPVLDDKGQTPEGRWFDTKRLIATDRNPVMAVPTFAVVPGGAEKPARLENPMC